MQSLAELSRSSLCHLSASEIAQLVRAREVSPVEVIQDHLERIEKLNPAINAFADLNSERALAEAKRAERLLLNGSAREAALLGVPVTVKSCIDVQGLRCAAGARLRASHVPAADATVVARLKQAGAIVVGCTATPELLMAYHTENEIQGRTNNPWDLRRTPGGSSGGEAAAIASGMSAGGFGSDGGGSIRVPAHFCGICGLKPTPGLIPTAGHYPPCAGPFALIGVVGPMARTVKDLQMLLAATAGYDPGDPASAPVSLSGPDLPHAAQLRVGYYESDGETPPTHETSAAIRTAATALRDRGFEVEPFRPDGLSKARELWFAIFVECSALLLKAMLRGHEAEISPNTREVLALAAKHPALTADRLLTTLMERDLLRLQFQKQMQDFPILLGPVSSTPAFLHEHAGWGAEHAADYLRTMTCCQHYNLLGNPAATIPIAQSREGLPIGVQIIGRPFKDNEVLGVAAILNEQFSWRKPPFAGALL